MNVEIPRPKVIFRATERDLLAALAILLLALFRVQRLCSTLLELASDLADGSPLTLAIPSLTLHLDLSEQMRAGYVYELSVFREDLACSCLHVIVIHTIIQVLRHDHGKVRTTNSLTSTRHCALVPGWFVPSAVCPRPGISRTCRAYHAGWG